MQKKEIERLKKKLKLNKSQRRILVGLLLGDACLETQNRGRTYRLKIEYSLKHRDYCEYIYEIFKEWTLTPPRLKEVVSREHRSVNICFSTVSHGAFRFYARQFYKGNRKRVPPLIEKLLTPQGLAFWFMDDGSFKSGESKGLIFNTQGYTEKDVNILVRVLNEKFGLKAWKRKQKEGFQIYISGESYESFLELISPYLHPSMIYKLPKARRTYLPKR